MGLQSLHLNYSRHLPLYIPLRRSNTALALCWNIYNLSGKPGVITFWSTGLFNTLFGAGPTCDDDWDDNDRLLARSHDEDKLGCMGEAVISIAA